MRCPHVGAVPVESVVTGEVLAALCPGCDQQLPAAFLTCQHDDVIETLCLNEPPGLGICNGCGTSAWFGRRASDSARVATLVAAGFDPASARRSVESGDPTLLIHTAFERPQAVLSFSQDVSAQDMAEFAARFRATQRERRVMFLPTVASDAPASGELTA